MTSQPFRFNSEAKYQPGPQKGPPGDVGDLTKAHVQVQLAPGKSFEAQYPNVFENYRLPLIESDSDVKAWSEHPMDWWQQQLNFAVWCATAGCGVSLKDHMAAEAPLLRSVYRFHVYYQIRRILVDIRAPLPQDQAWHPKSNPYNRRGYERICSEFGVSPHADWRVRGHSRGLGRVYDYWTNDGYHPVPGHPDFDPSGMSFTRQTGNGIAHVDYIKQDAAGADKAWQTFILDKSDGFTRPGVERVNDSIRTYVWAILGAQAQTRTPILATGTGFDAQKQFLANVEDAIGSPVDLPSAIKRYQDVLQYARSEVNFSFGVGLYMAPSDMLLRVGHVAGYNNLIVIATDKQALGLNSGLNTHDVPPDATNDTGEKGLVKPPAKSSAAEKGLVKPPVGLSAAEKGLVKPPVRLSAGPAPVDATTAKPPPTRDEHEDDKTALVVGSVAVGLVVLWFLR